VHPHRCHFLGLRRPERVVPVVTITATLSETMDPTQYGRGDSLTRNWPHVPETHVDLINCPTAFTPSIPDDRISGQGTLHTRPLTTRYDGEYRLRLSGDQEGKFTTGKVLDPALVPRSVCWARRQLGFVQDRASPPHHHVYRRLPMIMA